MKKISRRNLLRGASGLALPLPFLYGLGGARAAEAPKRVIFMFTSSGSVRKNWRPPTVGADPTPSPILKPLAEPDLKPYLTALSGLHIEASGATGTHRGGMATCLTASSMNSDCSANGPSMDFVLGQKFKGVTPFETLQFGVITRKPPNCTGNSFITYRPRPGGGFEGVFAEDNPAVMYEKLFANFAGAGNTMAPPLAEDRSVLDFAVNEYKRLAASLPTGDRARLEQHATMMRTLEQRLGSTTGNSPLCKKPAPGVSIADPQSFRNFKAVTEMQMDMLAAAFACDLTRVATLQFTTGESGLDWDSVDRTLNFRSTSGHATNNGIEAGETTSWWHGLSHIPNVWDPASSDPSDRSAIEALTRMQVWFAERLASLARRLKGYTDSDGRTVLDNTVIVWTTEVAEGNHSSKDMPFTVVGNLGGTLKSNVHLAYNGRQHGDIFATIGTAMGFPNFSKFGREGFSQGVLSDWLR